MTAEPTRVHKDTPSYFRGCGSSSSGSEGCKPLRCPKRRPSCEHLHSCCHQVEEENCDDDATQVTSNILDWEEQKDEGTCPTVSTTSHQLTSSSIRTKEQAPQQRCCEVLTRDGDDDIEGLRVSEITVSGAEPQPAETASEPNSNPTSDNSSPVLTKQLVRSFLTDYYEDFDSIFRSSSNKQVQKTCFEAFFDQYYTPDALWVRSSGNPIGRDQLGGMLTDHIDVEHALLVSIDHIRLLAGGLVATVVYTADLQFAFKGTPQNDRTVLTSVLQMQGVGSPKITHVHWSVGQPIPTTSRWD